MTMLDLDALATDVAAVLDRAGVPEGHRRCLVYGAPGERRSLDVGYWPHGEGMAAWNLRVDAATVFTDAQGKAFAFPAEFQFHGPITPVAFGVIQVVMARFGEESLAVAAPGVPGGTDTEG